ncbi:hypothetical protein A3D05_01075 [Candidatus Gottesmanbacteria bacterium RIFCSPHIGHO2_02_FULL_40_24]|nr:MAG: hypothetical protein A3D05_01075 [Candidatus Gottesmanbacteria bacterium RIFCSPHIGHO2_02_FULL_40_24]
MFSNPARKIGFVLLFLILASLIFWPGHVLAQPATPTPPPLPASNTATWEFDPVTTEVGKSADRARQLLWWLFQHPGIHTAPVLAQIWAIARNIVYVFVVLVIVAFGISLILGRRRGMIGPVFSGITSPVFGVNIPIIFIKILGLLLYVTFSYVVIVALIQISDIIMRFFIETVGGKDLFNIIFSGAGNTEANYITFVGYRDVNPLNLEMVNTSLFYVRLTSFTYNVMSTILVFRTIILWFLMIIAPFLALLMPFVFIRNTGWIWIGVFFQWLFYGPIFALFLASLTRIWVAGIPFPFDFSRVNKPTGQVYRTAINILWGGPAQTLSPGNSANYVDTFAEYFIALVMLWTCIVLPWLLLRIFRDYCCSMIAAGANTMNAIFDRLRQYPTPPPPVPIAPVTATGIAVELPFRQRIDEKIREVQRVRIEEISDISKVSTNEIARSMDLSVSRLSDISRMETNMMKRQEVSSYMDKIRAPEKISSPAEREKFISVKEELKERALKGDKVAQTLLQASDRHTQSMTSQLLRESRVTSARLAAQAKPEVQIGAAVPDITHRNITETVSSKAGISELRVKDVLSRMSVEDVTDEKKVQSVSKVTGVSAEKVRQVVKEADHVWKSTFTDHSQVVNQVSAATQTSEVKTREVLSKIKESELSDASKVREVARTTGVSEEKVKTIVKTSEEVKRTRISEDEKRVIDQVSAKENISTDAVKQILTKVSEKEISGVDNVRSFVKSSAIADEKVREVIRTAEKLKQEQPEVTEAELINTISKTTQLSTADTSKILQSITREQLQSDEKVKQLENTTGVSLEKIQDVVKSAKLSKRERREAVTEEEIAKVSKEVGLSETTTKEILSSVSASELTNEEKIREMEKKTGVVGERIKEAVRVREKVKAETAPEAPSVVSVEDYEEVKSMWLKHFRSAPVPITDTIKDRYEWLTTEEKKLTNITNLLSSANPELKQQGLERVSEILPFMLLGGFSEAEIMTYIKAKFEADRQVLDELTLEEKAKEKAKEELKAEEEETLVEVAGETEEKKAEELKMSTEIGKDAKSGGGKEKDLPEGNKNPKD